MKAVYKYIADATGADLNIELGFLPDHVKIINMTTMDVNEAWFDDGTLRKSVQMVASTGVVTEDADGIIHYAGSAGSAAKGVTLDAGAQVNTDDQALYVIAETYELEAGGAAVSTSVL